MFYFKYRGERKALFIDIPKCVSFRGIYKSTFSKTGDVDMQMSLHLDPGNREQKEFIDLFENILALFKSDNNENVATLFKSSMQDERMLVMYVRLDTDQTSSGSTILHTKLEQFPDGESMQRSFMTTGTIKLTGLCHSPRGMAFMRRVTRVRNEGPPPMTGLVIDFPTDNAPFVVQNETDFARFAQKRELTDVTLADLEEHNDVEEEEEEEEDDVEETLRTKRARIQSRACIQSSAYEHSNLGSEQSLDRERVSAAAAAAAGSVTASASASATATATVSCPE